MAHKNITLPMFGWKPRDYQTGVWNFMNNGGKRAILLWHRRCGKDAISYHHMIKEAATKPGAYWHVFPSYAQGRKAIWNAVDSDGVPFLKYFPDELVESTNSQDMLVKLKNGSTYQIIGADTYDRLVGANPVGVIMSEYPLQHPQMWRLIEPALLANGGWAIFAYTPRGKNHGKVLYDTMLDKEHWYVSKLTIDDTGVMTPEMLQDSRDMGVQEWFIQQEYYCSFNAEVEGNYFGSYVDALENRGRLMEELPFTENDVVTGWDLGVADDTVIVFGQKVGSELHILDVIRDNNKGLKDYAADIREWRSTRGAHFGQHFGPHDLMVREWSGGRSRLDVAYDMGLDFDVIPRKNKADTLDCIRSLLPMCKFNMASEEVRNLVDALRLYRREYDEELGVFKDKPVHDWTSHYVDAFSTLCWGFNDIHNTEIDDEAMYKSTGE